MMEGIDLSLQRAPAKGDIRLLALDINENQEVKLTAMQSMTQEEYNEALELLKYAVERLEEKDALDKEDGIK